jgi:DHA2 family multidrug resistance protein-like MFS transporter
MDETKEARIYRLRWWTLTAISVSVLVMVLDTTVMNVALPTIQRQMGATSSELQWMVVAYTMMLGALLMTAGSLGDRIGRGKTLRSGLVIFGITSVGAFLSATAMQLIICRVFMGAGAALMMPSTLSTLTNVFPEKERGQAIGVWAGLNAVGIALGPIIGGSLVQHYNWNSIFGINIPIVIFALILGWFFVPDTRDDQPRKLDIIGNLLSLAGLAMLIYGLVTGGSQGWTDVQVLATLSTSVILIALFIFWEKRTTHPLLELRFFRNPQFSTGICILIIIGLTLNGVIYILTYYMQFVRGYDPLGAGLRFVPFAIGMLFGSVMANGFVRRLGVRPIMATGFFGAAILLVVMSFLRLNSPYWQLGTELFLFSLFLGTIASSVTNVIMGSIPKEKAGVGSAVNTTFQMIAGTIGVSVLGAILASVYGANFQKSASAILGLPATLAQKASDSVGIAIGIANSGQLPAALANSLAQTARLSFMGGWSIIMTISSTIFVIGAIVVLIFMPSRQNTLIQEPGDKEQ